MEAQNTAAKYTAQQVFDIVLTGLRAQGRASLSKDGNCMYRGDGGCKCAAGFLIPDSVYENSMETVSAPLVISKTPALANLVEHSRLIDALQYAHDSHLASHGINSWEGEMHEIARRYGLQYTRSVSVPLPDIDPPLPVLAAPGAAV